MTNPLTEMDERRKVAAAAFDDNAERHEWYAGMVRAIRQSDEANHIGYYDTRTHVAVPVSDTLTQAEALIEELAGALRYQMIQHQIVTPLKKHRKITATLASYQAWKGEETSPIDTGEPE